jgi:hypothetical protein
MTSTQTATQLRISKEYRIGGKGDEDSAATIGELIECECCGRKISRVNKLNNGARVGSECALYLTRPEWRQTDEQIKSWFSRRNKKADAYLAAGNYA